MKKENTVKKYREFKKLFNLKQSKRNEIYTIYYKKNNLTKERYGIHVSKKNGNAVIRNKIKRQVREFIHETTNYNGNYDFVVVISPKYDVNDFKKNEELFVSLITFIKEQINE